MIQIIPNDLSHSGNQTVYSEQNLGVAMYLRPDEIVKVLEKLGFTMISHTSKSYGFIRNNDYIYVNREARLGRAALVISPTLREWAARFAEPAAERKYSQDFTCFALDNQGHYGIPYGFSSRFALERFILGLFR